MAVPWTQTLSVRWRPELRFYEQSTSILRALDDREVLKAFAVAEDAIGARLLDAGHEMSVRQDGLSLDLFGQDADLEEVWPLVMVAVELIDPTYTTEATARFAHVVPIELRFDEAISRSLDRLFKLPAAGDLATGDFALLMDLTAPDEMKGQMEFGIIRANEAQLRLTGRGQRIARSSPSIEHRDWRTTKFPDVSLFADSRWSRPVRIGTDRFDEVREIWAAAEGHAAHQVDALHERIDNACYNEDVRST